jgi:tRNA threonylcarbamoyladenosine biosynthesis protein TsaB
MNILTIRTDKPEAEIGLYQDTEKRAYVVWRAHRELAETLHGKISAMLAEHNTQLQDIEGIICFKGPGSFTGLRIGLTVANALSYSLQVPIVADMGEDWIQNGITRLKSGENEKIAMPEYGADVHITKPKH